MPPPLVIGRRVFYRQQDVEAFEARMLDAAGRAMTGTYQASPEKRAEIEALGAGA